ncbi:MAG TPA: hypothetical protein VKU41_27285 [Polyangiaceae bacterium]|nr:hypothetical protein [Polyangiaceae bacterium]
MRRRAVCASALALSVSAPLLAACGGSSKTGAAPDAGSSGGVDGGGPAGEGGTTEFSDDGGGPSSGDSGAPEGGGGGSAPMRVIASKVDLLFMIDNSASMGDKQAIVAASVPELINRLVNPNCIDGSGRALGLSQNGQCATGQLEFEPVHDMHVGIVTSSLGGRGGDQCAPDAKNSANMALLAHNDDRGELINRAGPNETPVADAAPDNFLAWFPSVPANQGATPPSGMAVATAAALVSDFTGMIQGAHEHGCGFEAQNEAWYRFLIQPDPFDAIVVNGSSASLQGIDETILAQRADFLRPDSLVAVIVVTDENEEVADPMVIGGQGWVFENASFPGSPNLAAPEGSIECSQQDPNNLATTGPNDPNCTTCAFLRNDPNFATRCPKDGTSGTQGYLDPSDDALNVRFFHQKARFGVSVSYPLSRYVRGLTTVTVPDSTHEHDVKDNYIGDEDAQANCVSPLFAAALPTHSTDELCALKRGPRSSELVYYAAIAGVPHQLLQVDPTDPNSPQKPTLTDADWLKITGKDPEHYDFTGADFHMIESTQPRTSGNLPPGVINASACPPTAGDSCDPINGREWSTGKADLQFACIFDLQQPKDCSQPQYTGACDCAAFGPDQSTPLCKGGLGADGGPAYTQTQIRGKAYPSLREMVIAHQMGGQGIVSSLCPIHTTPANADNPADPLYGYRPAWDAIVDHFAGSFRKP